MLLNYFVLLHYFVISFLLANAAPLPEIFRVKHPATGKYWSYQSSTDQVRLNTGVNLYLQQEHQIDLFGGSAFASLRDVFTGNYIRHSFFVLRDNPFQANNYDYAYVFIHNTSAEAGTYRLYNNYPSGTFDGNFNQNYYVGYDSLHDLVKIVPYGDSSIVDWIFEAVVPVSEPTTNPTALQVAYFSNNRQFSMSNCGDPGDGANFRQCFYYNPVLNKFPNLIAEVMADSDPVNNHDGFLCFYQAQVCGSILENKDGLSSACNTTFNGCRQALRHLHQMMFKSDPTTQQCNNVALKSIRAFFHDFTSSGIDGSLLSESNIAHNVGLCRFNEYVNVLSDATMCDPGSIIAMAGQLGYLACGIRLWDLDQNAKPFVSVGRPYSCSQNLNPLVFENGEIKKEFSDLQLASNSTSMERFHYALNGFFNAPPNGEVDYTARAQAAAHIVGRVTCPLQEKIKGRDVTAKAGFFSNKPSIAIVDGYPGASEYFARNTQCVSNLDGTFSAPPYGLVINSTAFPVTNFMTDFNPEGGFCGMPTQFLHTITVGNEFAIPRWVETVQDVSPHWPSPFQPGQCTAMTSLYIPWELLTINNVVLPSSPALDAFLRIAWDGVGTINSAWDTCDTNCAVPVLQNRLCGGSGLSDFSFDSTPSSAPSPSPSSSPQFAPTNPPSTASTMSPSSLPSSSPILTTLPTKSPVSVFPTSKPTQSPTSCPSYSFRTKTPSKAPSTPPTKKPIISPTKKPIYSRTKKPKASSPTENPSLNRLSTKEVQ